MLQDRAVTAAVSERSVVREAETEVDPLSSGAHEFAESVP